MTEPSDLGPGLEIVRDEELGTVQIGTLPASPAGTVVLSVRGGSLYVDPTQPDAPSAFVITEPGAAAGLLFDLHGLELRDLPREGAPRTSVAWRTTETSERLAHLGVLTWQATHGPLQLDRALLRLELAVAQAQCADLLDLSIELGPPLSRFAETVLVLAKQYRTAGSEPHQPGLEQLTADAVDLLVLDPPDDARLAADLVHEAELREALSVYEVGDLDLEIWGLLTGSARPQGAGHAGDGTDSGDAGDLTATGVSSLDWTRVPAGLLATGENTVTWTLSRNRRSDGSLDAWQIDVRVGAVPPPPDGGLVDQIRRTAPLTASQLARLSSATDQAVGFSVHAARYPLPLCTGELRPDPQEPIWRGGTTLPDVEVDARDITVHVGRAGLRTRPASGPLAGEREGMRWAARGLGLIRLALAGGVTDPDAVRAPLERARQLFGEAAAGGSPTAVRRQFRTELLLAAYLTRLGDSRGVRRVQSRVAALAPAVDLADRFQPHLDHPAWRPGVAELAALGRIR